MKTVHIMLGIAALSLGLAACSKLETKDPSLSGNIRFVNATDSIGFGFLLDLVKFSGEQIAIGKESPFVNIPEGNHEINICDNDYKTYCGGHYSIKTGSHYNYYVARLYNNSIYGFLSEIPKRKAAADSSLVRFTALNELYDSVTVSLRWTDSLGASQTEVLPVIYKFNSSPYINVVPRKYAIAISDASGFLPIYMYQDSVLNAKAGKAYEIHEIYPETTPTVVQGSKRKGLKILEN